MSHPELVFVPDYQKYFDEPAGKEHYKLLGNLVQGKTGIVVDVGTLYGTSALALSSNPNVAVWSYDITNRIPKDAAIRTVPNIVFKLENGIAAVKDFAHSTDLIVLDIDPHDGLQEKEFFDELVKYGFRGTVVCDDIHLNDAMKSWWDSITQRKEDVTDRGHWSGTGLVFFE